MTASDGSRLDSILRTVPSYELGAGALPAEAAYEVPVAAPPPPPDADLRNEVHKIQGVILSLHERLLAVEGRGP